MKFHIAGNPDYGEVQFELAPGESVNVESGAMSRMSHLLELKTHLMGGILPALARKVFGGESFFLGRYSGPSGGELAIAPALPGTVVQQTIDAKGLLLTAGSFLAATEGVTIKTRFAGMRSLLSREGAFLLDCRGQGDLFFNAYGAIVEHEINGELIVDTGHVVAWEPSLDYKIGGMGGLKQTLFSGEGLVMRFQGQGKLWLQTRTLGSTAGWITPYLLG
ncbi:MAG: hypothetical protein ACI841_000562 [Planctomycetota bacterium]|jgi:uncharacterized protein (TIGR00266 family)